MKSLAEIKKILKETPQSGESKKSESVIYTGNKSTGNGQQKSTTNSKTTQGAKAVNTNSSKTTDTVLFKPGTASQSLWKSEKSFDKVLDTQKKAREEQSKSRKAYADFARDILSDMGAFGRTAGEMTVKKANNRLSDDEAIGRLGMLSFEDVAGLYRKNKDYEKYLSDNASSFDYADWIQSKERAKERSKNYSSLLHNLTPSGKAATGDEGLSDEAYRFKMDNLTEADAKSYANFYEKKASEKNIDYPDRVRYKSIADTYRKKYIDIKYGSIKNKPDFEENIAYKPENTDSRTAGSMSDQYYIINTDAKTLKEQGLEKGNEKYLLMTDDEKNIYNYLYNKSGLKEATDYLNYIDNMLNKRYADERLKEAREYGAEHPVISTVDTVVTSPVTAFVSGLGTLKAAVEGADENDPTMLAERIKSETRQSVMDNHIKSKAGQIIYSSLTSAADNALNALVAQGLVGATALSGAAKAKAIGRIGGALMGSEAAASGILAGKANGMSDRGAVAYGIAQGVIELLTEKYSIEKIMGESGTVVRTLLKNSFTEGSEEIASYWANMVLDEIAGQGVEKKYKGLIAQGYSAEEASKQIVTDIVYGNLESFIGGALAGGMMSAGTTLPGVISAGGVKNYNKQLELANRYNNMSEEERKEFDRKMAAEQAANVLSGDKVGPVEVATALDALGVPEPDKVAKAIENFKDTGKTSERLHNDARVADVMEILNERGYFKTPDSENTENNSKKPAELRDTIKQNSENILKDKEIFSVNTRDVKLDGNNATEKIFNYFKSIGGYAVNSVLGKVELNKAGAKSTVFHGIGKNKVEAATAIKDVIEKGKIISHEKNWKNRGYDTYIIAGNGNIDGEKSIIGVIVKNYPKSNLNNKFYLHEVIKIGASDMSVENNAVHVIKSTPISEDSVTQTEGKVKGENENFRNETKKSDYVPPIKVNTSNENDRNMVKTITDGIGKEGRRAYHERIELEYTAGYNGNKAVFLRDFNAFYTKGFTGGKISEVNSRFSDRLTLGTRRAAFKAGQADRAAAIDAKYTEANRAVIRDGGLILNHNTEGREDIERLDELGKKFGVSIEIQDTVVNSRGNEVNGLYSQGEIKISKKAVDSFKSPEAAERFILGHELLHRVETLAPKQYVKLRERIYDYVQRQNSAEITAAENAVLKKDVDMDTAIDEIAADYIGNEKFALDTAMHDLTLAEKIRGMARDILNVLGIKKYSEAERIARVWEKACEEAKRSVKKADSKVGNDVKREGEVKYSIVNLPNGKNFVRASRQVIKSNNPEQWAKDVKKYIDTVIREGGNLPVATEDGEIFFITTDTSGKAMFRNSVKMQDGTYRKMTDEEYAIKLRAETHIDELISVSKNTQKTRDDTKKHRFSKDGFEYRTAFFEDFDGGYYRMTISVGKTGYINTVYNVGKIEEALPPRGSKAKQNNSAMRVSASSVKSISQKNQKSNNFSKNNSEKSSSGDLNEVIKENEKLKKENEKLKELKDHYKGQMLRSPNQYAPSSVNIKKVVNRVAKGYTGNRNLADDIKQAQELLSKCIASSGKGNTERTNELYNQYKERIDFIAGDIANNTRQKNDSLYREYRSIKDSLKGVTVKVDESWVNDLNGKNGYTEFKKRNLGTVRMSLSSGTPIDVLYNELGGRFGELFPEEIVNSADQLIYLTDLLKSMSDFYENPYNSDMDGAIEGISETIDLELLALSGERTQADYIYDTAEKRAEKLIEQERKRNEKEMDKLKKKNEKLEARAYEAQQQMMRTPSAYNAGIENFKKIIKEVAPDYVGKTDLVGKLTKAHSLQHKAINYAMQDHADKNKIDYMYKQYTDMMNEIAHDIVLNTSVRDEAAEEYNKKITDRIKGVTIKVEDEWKDNLGLDGYNDFRKRNFGRLNLSTEDGIEVRELYNELSYKYDNLFPELVFLPEDMLEQISDVAIMHSGNRYTNPYILSSETKESDIETATKEVFDELDMAIFNLSSKKTRADLIFDEAQKQIDAARAERDAKIKETREKYQERLETFKAKQIEKSKKAKQMKADMSARQQLLRLARRMKRLADTGKMSKANQALVHEIVDKLDVCAVNLTNESLKNLKSLEKWYKNAAQQNNFVPNPRIEAELERLDSKKKRIGNMSMGEVAILTEALQNIDINVENADKEIGKEGSAYEKGMQTIENIKGADGSSAYGLGHLKDSIITELINPVNAIHRITGYNDNDALYQAARDLRDAETIEMKYEMQANELFWEFNEDKKFMKHIFEDFKTFKIQTFDDLNQHTGYKEIRLNPAMIISLQQLALNNTSLNDIVNGGVTIPDEKLYKNGLKKGDVKAAYDRGETIRISIKDLKEITKSLEAKELKYIRQIEIYFNQVSKNEINEVSQRIEGIDKAAVKHYYPINVNTDFVKRMATPSGNNATLDNRKSMHERILGSRKPIMLYAAPDVLAESIKEHSRYVAYAIPVRNFKLLWNIVEHGETREIYEKDKYGEFIVNKYTGKRKTTEVSKNKYENSVKNAVRQKWGQDAVKYIDDLITEIESGRSEKTSKAAKLLNKAHSQYIKAVLTMNIPVAINQVASFPSAAPVLGWRALLSSLKDFGKVDLDLISEYTAVQWNRTKGVYDPTIADAYEAGGGLPKWLDWMMASDAIITRKLWKASEYYVRQHKPKLKIGTDEYYTEVAKIYEQAMQETQPNSGVMERPAVLRADSATKLIMPFIGEPLKNVNLIYDAVGNVKAKKKQLERAAGTEAQQDAEKRLKEAKKYAVRTIGSQIAASAAYSVFVALARVAVGGKNGRKRYEDEEGNITIESFLKKVAQDFVVTSITQVPFTGDLLDFITAMITGEKYYPPELISVQAITDVTEAVIDTYNLINDVCNGEGGTWQEIAERINSNTVKASSILGIPLKNVENIANSVMHWASRVMYHDNPTMQKYVSAKFSGALVEKTKDEETGEIKYKPTKEAKALLYNAFKKGESDNYETILFDLIDDGVKASDLETSMRSLSKKDEGFDIEGTLGAVAGVKKGVDYELYEKYLEKAEKAEVSEEDLKNGIDIIESGKPYKEMYAEITAFTSGMTDKQIAFFDKIARGKYTPDELGTKAYKEFSEKRGQTVKELEKQLDTSGLGNKEMNDIYNKIYQYAENVALEEASGGEYIIDTEWINEAKKSQETIGVNTAEFIRMYNKYDSKVYSTETIITKELGYDIKLSLEYSRLKSIKGTDSERDENGQIIKGKSKQDKVIAIIDSMDITDEEKAYLFGIEYKSNDNNPWARSQKANYKKYVEERKN